jgi:hypothetical protein
MFPSACRVVFFLGDFRWIDRGCGKPAFCRIFDTLGCNLRELEISWGGVCQKVIHTTEPPWLLTSFPIKLSILVYPLETNLALFIQKKKKTSFRHGNDTLDTCALTHWQVRWPATMETTMCYTCKSYHQQVDIIWHNSHYMSLPCLLWLQTTYMKKNGTTDPPGFRETWDVSKINQKTVIHQRKLSTNQLFHTIPTYVPQIHFMKISTPKRLSRCPIIWP